MPTVTVNGVEHGYDEAGDGPPLLLIHAGIADRRMWDDVMEAFSSRHRVIRYDMQGYGVTPLPDGPFAYTADAAALLEALDAVPASVVGVSMGAGVAMDLALAHPEVVDRLVLVAAGLGGWDWDETMEAADAAELEALDRGDFDGASWHNVEFWVDGPHRTADDVDVELREKVFAMQRQAFSWENPNAVGSWLVSDRHLRLGEIAAPTLIVTGELDQPDFAGIAVVLEDQIPDARWESIAGVTHLPPMEAPAGFAELVLDFLAD